ncbi:hypothetical protein, partial [Streptomyces sp. NPDC000188]|uniref:hypothetical protein n=1 Tax=Streptomyces sp. NPDC000188 TaxID=3154245 RepID=UPI00332B69B5
MRRRSLRWSWQHGHPGATAEAESGAGNDKKRPRLRRIGIDGTRRVGGLLLRRGSHDDDRGDGGACREQIPGPVTAAPKRPGPPRGNPVEAAARAARRLSPGRMPREPGRA